MATKTFTIEINGISQSVSAIDALLNQLDALDDKINSLSDVDTGDIKSSLESIRKELTENADNWEDIADKIQDVTKQVNTLERTYKSLEDPFKTDQIRQYGREVDEIGESLSDVKKTSDSISGLGNFSNDVEKSTQKVDKLTESLRNANRAEDQLGTKLTVNLQGMVLEFDDVNQAIGVLEDKLFQLAATGQQGSSQFQDITKQIVNLRVAVKQVDTELESAFSGGLSKLISGVGTITSLASIGEGISQLFGVEEIDGAIQKFAALSLVLQGVSQVQQELTNRTSAFTKAFGALNAIVNPITNSISKVISKFTLFNKALDIANLGKAKQLFNELQAIQAQINIDPDTFSGWDTLEERLGDISDEFKGIGKGVEDNAKYFGDLSQITQMIQDAFDTGLIDKDQFDEATKAVEKFRNNLHPLTSEAREIKQELGSLGIIFTDELPKSLTKTQRILGGVANGIKAVGVAFKGLLKATIILGLIQAAIEAVTWVWDKLVGLVKSFAGWDLEDQVNAFDSLNQSIEAANKTLETYKTNLDHLVDTKVISNQTRLTETIAEYNKALEKSIQLQKALSSIREAKSLDLDASNTWFTGADIKNAEDFRAEFELLQKAVQGGVDRFKALEGASEELKEKFEGNFFQEWWNTAGDAASDYASLQKAVIKDINYQIANLDLSKGEAEVKKFIDLLDTPMYNISLANVENLFPEEEWAKVLKRNIEQIKEYYSQIQALQKEAAIEAQKTQEQISNNNIAAIRDRFKRERAELDNAYKQELKDAADNEELKKSITSKYDTQRAQLLNSQASEVRNVQNQIDNNQIAAMQDGFNKKLAELNQQRQQEIQSAKDSEILVGEQIAAINKKYDKLVLDAKTEFFKNRQKLLEDYSNTYRQLQAEIAQIEYEIATSKIEGRSQDQIEALGFTEESIENIRAYYDNIRDISNEGAKALAEANKELTQTQTSNQLESEVIRNKERIEAIKEDYNNGLLNKEDYDKAIQEETDVHYKRMDTITRQGEQKLVDIQREYDQTAKNNAITAINERIAAINESYGKVEANTKVSKLGIIDYGATKKELKKAQAEYSAIFNQIGIERANLQKSFDNNQISFGDFRLAKKELDNLEKEVVKSQQTIETQLDSLFTQTVQSLTQYIGSYVSALGSIWSTYNEIQMMRFEQEQARLEEEYDILEEAYQKQEELTKKHTDKLSDIEDELKTSRGDRRAHLIEQLNAERAAQLASLQEEQRIEKQKEQNQKKQDALEKKRREQEKKNSIVQATINAYTAMTNALAVQPWFVGLALSAVALAMGLAQVAMIKKQKYAKGGLLRGNSHNAGGIPVGMTGIEVEGNEYVVNKKSTAKNLPLIDFINNSNKSLTREDLDNFYNSGKRNVTKNIKSKFADGGVLPNVSVPNADNTIVIQDDRPIVAQIVDIVNSADNYRQIQVLSGLSGKSV